MKSSPIWLKTIHVLAFSSLFIMLAGFSWAVKEWVKPSTMNQPSPKAVAPSDKQGGKLLLGLGDSLTRGVGDQSGQGYFGIIQKEWQDLFRQSQAVNLSVRGYTSAHLRDQLKKTQIREFVKEADAMVITIGGNDLFQGSEDLEKTDLTVLSQRKKHFRENLSAILTDIRKLNPDCSVYLLSLYNPFADLKENKNTSNIVADWNYTMMITAQSFPRVTVVPVYDLFLSHPGSYLFSDHFHPNRQGYIQIAKRLWQVMNPSAPEVEQTDENSAKS